MILYNGPDASTLARAQRLMSFFDDVPVYYSVAERRMVSEMDIAHKYENLK